MALAYTAAQLIYEAARTLCLIRSTDAATPNRGLSTDQVNDCFYVLNRLLDGWQIDGRKVFAIRADQYPLTSASQFYLIGANAPASTVINGQTYIGINAPRPTQIEQANIIIPSTNPPVRYPVGLINAQQWSTIAVQLIPSAIPQVLWYDYNFQTFGGVQGLAAINLWPGPLQTYNMELFTWQQLQSFADLVTSYQLPPGYADALTLSLAVKIAPQMRFYFKIEDVLLQDVKIQAAEAVQKIDDYNAREIYMPQDPAFQSADGRPGAWNYLDGGFGRGTL